MTQEDQQSPLKTPSGPRPPPPGREISTNSSADLIWYGYVWKRLVYAQYDDMPIWIIPSSYGYIWYDMAMSEIRPSLWWFHVISVRNMMIEYRFQFGVSFIFGQTIRAQGNPNHDPPPIHYNPAAVAGWVHHPNMLRRWLAHPVQSHSMAINITDLGYAAYLSVVKPDTGNAPAIVQWSRQPCLISPKDINQSSIHIPFLFDLYSVHMALTFQ